MKRFSLLTIAVMLVMAIFFFGFTYQVKAAVDTTPPTAPSNLIATAVSPSLINLSWTASTDNVGVKNYRVYREGAWAVSPTATNTIQNGLPGKQYCYTVKAIETLAWPATGNVLRPLWILFHPQPQPISPL